MNSADSKTSVCACVCARARARALDIRRGGGGGGGGVYFDTSPRKTDDNQRDKSRETT